MNHIYRLVFNRALGRVQVASELACGSVAGAGRSTSKQRHRLPSRLAIALLLASASMSAAAQVADNQLPTGGSARGGIAAVDGIASNGSTMTINQVGKRAVIDWDSFNVGKDALVQFVQNADHVALNRILDSDPSQIMGKIESNGTVFLINQHGIVFGRDARLQVGGLIASTLGLSDAGADDFLDENNTGFDLVRGTSPGAAGAIINSGIIRAGSVDLIGAYVNNTRDIFVENGHIGLTAADDVTLNLSPGVAPTVLINVALRELAPEGGGVANSGTLSASFGGRIELQAAAAPGLLSAVVNNSGILFAGSAASGADGTVSLKARGGAITLDGTVIADKQVSLDTDNALLLGAGLDSGSLTISAHSVSQSGGALRVTGDTSIVVAGDATLGAAANNFVGKVNLSGGNVIINDANALTLGTVTAGTLTASSHGALDLGTSTIAGALSANSNGGAISQTGALKVTGVSTIDAGAGDITLENAGNTFDRAVGLTSGGHSRIRSHGALTLSQLDVGSLDATNSGPAESNALDFGGGVVRGALSATSAGKIFQTGALSVAGATTLRTNGDIGFSNPDNAFGGTVSLGGNNVYISDAAMLRLGTLNVNALFARAPQLRLSGSVTTSGYQFYGGDLLLERDTQLTSTVGAVDFGGRVDGAYALGVTGRWSTFAGNIGDAAALSSFDTSGVRERTTIGGNLTTTGNIAFGVTEVRSGNYTVRSTGGSIAVTGALNAEAEGRGQLTLDARGAVSLGADAGASGGLQSLALEGATVSARGIRVTETLTVDSGSDYVQQGIYDVGGNARFVVDGDITLANAANRFGGRLSLDGGNATVVAASALALDDVKVDGLRVLGAAAVSLNNVTATTLDATSNGVLDFGNTTLTDTLDARSNGGAITQSRALTVAGRTTINAGAGDITLGNSGNDFVGTVELTGGHVVINDANALRLGTVTAGALTAISHGALNLGSSALSGALSANSNGGSISQSGALTVAGSSALTAGSGDITLDNPSNSFTGKVTLAGRDIALRAAGSLPLGSVTARSLSANATKVTLGGNITTSEDQDYNAAVELAANVALSADGNVTFASSIDGGHALSISSQGNLAVAGAVGAATALGGLAIDASSATLSSSVDIAGNLSIDAATGGIRQSNGFRVGGVSSFDAHGSDIALSHAGNDFSGAVNLTGANVALNDGNALTLGTVNVTALRVSSHGALDLGTSTLAGALSANSNGGAIRQAGVLDVAGSSTINAGSGAITLDNAGNDFVGAVNLTGGNIDINDANALTLGPATATTLRASSVGELRLTGAIEATTIDLATAGRFVNDVGATALDVSGGNGQWRIFLDSPTVAHQFNGLDSGNTALWNTAAFAPVTAGGNRYLFAYQPTLTVTGANLRKTYGDTLDLSQAYIVSGAMQPVAGAYRTDTVGTLFTGRPDLVSGGAGSSAGVGGSPYAINVSRGTLDTSVSGYALNFVDGTLQVDPRALTITANNGSKSYGQAGGLNGYQVDGLLNGDSVNKVDLASAGTSASANVGDYTITAANADGSGLSNYDIHYVDGVLSIGKIGLTITANNGNKTYGQTGGLNGYTVDGLLKGDSVNGVALSSAGSTATANVGNYSITASNADGSGLDNYAITYIDGVLSVGKAGLTITANNGNKTYGQTGGLNGYTVDGLINGDLVNGVELSSVGGTATTNVGNYTITAANADGNGLSNYDISYVDGVLSIGKAGLTITANNGSKTYGQTGGLNGYATTGLVNGDSVNAVELSSAGSTATANVGDYTITTSNADGNGLSNYDITYIDGVLSIGKAGLTITANNGSKTYGQNGGLAGHTVEGLLIGDNVSGVELSSGGSAVNANVGDYTITASNADGNGLSNYDITYIDGVLSIGKAGLTITANNATKSIGQTIALDGYRVDGLLNRDVVDSVVLSSDGTGQRAAPGGYTIVASNAAGSGLANYDIRYADGTLQVEGIATALVPEIATEVAASQSTGANAAPNANGLQSLQLQGPQMFTIEGGGLAPEDEESCQTLSGNADCSAPE